MENECLASIQIYFRISCHRQQCCNVIYRNLAVMIQWSLDEVSVSLTLEVERRQ